MTNDETFLLAIRGTLKPKTVEESRTTHNMTAGDPQGVAAARSLGDLSHNVFVTLGETQGAGELLILDLWNNFDGFKKFFSDPQVAQGGGMIFESRDSATWTQARDIRSFMLPVPAGKGVQAVGLVRGVVKSREAAKAAFDRYAKESVNPARMLGQISHEIFFRMSPPGEPESLELLGVDMWMTAEGMGSYYAEPKHMAPISDVFAGAPAFSTWKRPEGSWVEW